MGVSKLFEMFHVRDVFRKFFRERALNFVTFSNVGFSAELILSNLNNKNDTKGVRGHPPPKNFENIHSVMLFEQFSGKICLYFWPLILGASPNEL